MATILSRFSRPERWYSRVMVEGDRFRDRPTAEEVRQRIEQFLLRYGPIPGESESDRLSFAYLDSGHIDSVTLVLMVTELEEEFGIRLDARTMQSEDFRTLGGLVQIFYSLTR